MTVRSPKLLLQLLGGIGDVVLDELVIAVTMVQDFCPEAEDLVFEQVGVLGEEPVLLGEVALLLLQRLDVELVLLPALVGGDAVPLAVAEGSSASVGTATAALVDRPGLHGLGPGCPLGFDSPCGSAAGYNRGCGVVGVVADVWVRRRRVFVCQGRWSHGAELRETFRTCDTRAELMGEPGSAIWMAPYRIFLKGNSWAGYSRHSAGLADICAPLGCPPLRWFRSRLTTMGGASPSEPRWESKLE